MLVDTENTSDQFITRLDVDMNIHGDLHDMDGYRIFVIYMDMLDIHQVAVDMMDIHLKIE